VALKTAVFTNCGEDGVAGQSDSGNTRIGTHQTRMQAVCDILESLVVEGTVRNYAVDGATAAGFHGEPLATRDVDVFVFLDSTSGPLPVSSEPLYASLARRGFASFEEEALLIHNLPVQFLTADTPP